MADVACDNTYRFLPQAPFHALFIPLPIELCSNKNVMGHDLVAQPLETHVYNRNISSHFCSLFFSFVRHVAFFGGLPLYTRSRSPFPVSCFPFPVPRSPFPVPRSPFSVLRSPFSVLRSPFSVLRSPFPVSRSLFSFTSFSHNRFFGGNFLAPRKQRFGFCDSSLFLYATMTFPTILRRHPARAQK